METRKVDVEAHFFTSKYVKMLSANRENSSYDEDALVLEKLLDLGEGRLKDMDMAGVDFQVISLSNPGCERFKPSVGTALAKSCNEELSKAVEKYPDRFVGLAALAPKSPSEAADELERAVKELGLMGWKTHSNYGDTYLDAPQYWPILEKAEKMDVPIFLHPTMPAIAELRSYGYALAGPAFGFSFDAAMCMMRLILSGVFDRYPRLKLILGHLGETMPFSLSRIDFAYLRPWIDTERIVKCKKKPSDYFRNNVWVNTSGNFHQPAVTCTYQALGAERMLFGADYPYDDTVESVQCIEASSIPERDKEKIYHLNAEKLFRIQ